MLRFSQATGCCRARTSAAATIPSAKHSACSARPPRLHVCCRGLPPLNIHPQLGETALHKACRLRGSPHPYAGGLRQSLARIDASIRTRGCRATASKAVFCTTAAGFGYFISRICHVFVCGSRPHHRVAHTSRPSSSVCAGGQIIL